MNKFMAMGRLTADPEIKYSQGQQQTAVARFRIAVDRKGKDAQADFFQCVAFGKTAEFSEKFLKKASKVIVIGRLQTGEYTNKDGQKVSTVEVVAEELEFAESKKAEMQQGQQAAVQPVMPVQPQAAYQPQAYQPQAAYQVPQGQPPIYVGANDPGFMPVQAPQFQ